MGGQKDVYFFFIYVTHELTIYINCRIFKYKINGGLILYNRQRGETFRVRLENFIFGET